MFPGRPADLSVLSDEELAAAESEFLAAIKHVAANKSDPEVVGDLTTAQVVAEMAEAVEHHAEIKAAIKERADEIAGYDTSVAELAAKAGVDPAALEAETPDDEPADEPAGDDEPADEPEAAPATEATAVAPVTASARKRPLPAARRHKATPQDEDPRGMLAQVSSQEVGIERGQALGRHKLGELLNFYVKRNRVAPGATQVVASATFDFPPERFLDTERELNMEKIQRVTGPEALVASGGLCAPLEPIYDLPGVETQVRPVRDALPSFQANRGGVIVGATPTIGDYADAVGVITAAENAAGGTDAVKSCFRIECPEFSPVEVDAIYSCIEADNLASRSYPELMARIDALVRTNQARLADSKLLTKIKAGSVAVAGGPYSDGGGVSSLFGDLLTAAAGMRSRNRMAAGSRLRVLIPEWIIDLLQLDVLRQPNSDFAPTREGVRGYFDRAGITAAFYLDGSADGGQIFGAQGDGALLVFPTEAEAFLYPEGTWLHLDAGTLDLGIVRDSSLNSTNDFQIFAETWEEVAYVGVESLAITSTVCPSGTLAAPKDMTGICDGD